MMRPEKNKILEIKQVDVHYGSIPALKDVSIDINEGEIVTLLGSNGAGKTTTLTALYGITPVTKGDMFCFGKRTNGLSPQVLVASGVCYVPEGGQVFAPMTVMDNLILGSYSRRRKDNKKIFGKKLQFVFNLFPVLNASKKRLAGSLSGGERQMLALGRALMSAPKILLLDEPSLGLAPLVISEVMDVISKMRDGGLSVLLVEQNARAALKIADRGYVLEGGRIMISGKAEELITNESVRSAYLGKK